MNNLTRKLLFSLLLVMSYSLLQAQKIVLPYNEYTGVPVIKVLINGKMYNFIFDTGAENSFIDSGILSTPKIGSEIQTGAIYTQKFSSAIKILDSIQIGSVYLRNLRLNEINFQKALPYSKKCFNINGILGSDILHNYTIDINPSAKQITLINPKTDTINRALFQFKSFPFKLYKNSFTPTVEFKIYNKKTFLTLDLGGANYIGISYNRFIKNINASKNCIISKGSTYSSIYNEHSSLESRNYFVKNVDFFIGENKFENQNILFIPDIINNIGYGFLKNFETIIDWEHKMVYLKQISNPIFNNSAIVNLGFSWMYQSGKIIVSELRQDFNKLKIGDEILKINDHLIDPCNTNVFALLSDGINNPVVILRNNKEMKINL